MRHKGMPASHYCGGGIHKDNDTWYLRVRYKPVLSIPHKNQAAYFIQLTPDEAYGTFLKALEGAKRRGEIIDFMFQHIDHFWTAKEFEKKVMQRVRKKK